MQERIQNIIASMTLEEKVGQMFVARRPQDPEQAMEALKVPKESREKYIEMLNQCVDTFNSIDNQGGAKAFPFPN